MDTRSVVLVEGISDRLALLALAERRGVDLPIVAIGGAQAIGRALEQYAGRRVAGLCDAPEEPHFRRALERAGLGSDLDRAGMERLGFFTCEQNLEDELIRAAGPHAVVDLLERHGDLGSFRTFQKQPQWRGRPAEDQLGRYLHAADRRNVRYPPLLVRSLDLARVPRPLAAVLDHATAR